MGENLARVLGDLGDLRGRPAAGVGPWPIPALTQGGTQPPAGPHTPVSVRETESPSPPPWPPESAAPHSPPHLSCPVSESGARICTPGAKSQGGVVKKSSFTLEQSSSHAQPASRVPPSPPSQQRAHCQHAAFSVPTGFSYSTSFPRPGSASLSPVFGEAGVFISHSRF